MEVVINGNLPAIPKQGTAIQHEGGFYQNILASVGYSNPPLGSLLKKLSPFAAASGQWFVASPMVWQASHNDAMIVAAGDDLRLTEVQARVIFSALSQWLQTENMTLHWHNANTWLLQAFDKPPLTSLPIQRVIHQSLMPLLQSWDQTLFWQRFFTEVQMFLSTQSFNAEQTVVNGLWFWGNEALHLPNHKMLLYREEEQQKIAAALSIPAASRESVSKWTEQHIILADATDQSFLLQKTRRWTTNWRWNNLSYQIKPAHWFSRILRG